MAASVTWLASSLGISRNQDEISLLEHPVFFCLRIQSTIKFLSLFHHYSQISYQAFCNVTTRLSANISHTEISYINNNQTIQWDFKAKLLCNTRDIPGNTIDRYKCSYQGVGAPRWEIPFILRQSLLCYGCVQVMQNYFGHNSSYFYIRNLKTTNILFDLIYIIPMSVVS